MNMIPLLIVGYMLFGLLIYSLLKVASDADDEMERLYEEMRKLNNLDK